MEPDIEYYRGLERKLKIQGRAEALFAIGFVFCIVSAANHGAHDGWPWLCFSLSLLLCFLWARIDRMETILLRQIYLSAVK